MRRLVTHGAEPLFVHHADYAVGAGTERRREATTALMAATGMGGGNARAWVEPDRGERESLTLEAVKLAVELGVDLNAANTDGRTALDAAKALEYETVVTFLVEEGARPGSEVDRTYPMTLKICVAGVTGWTGSAVARAMLRSPTFELAGAVARTTAGQDVGRVLGLDETGVLVSSTIEQALSDDTDVLIDYTHPTVVKANVSHALSRSVSAVVGTSGLTAEDYSELGDAARRAGVGVIAAGNFSLSAALVKHFAGIASRHMPHWEIIDYAHAPNRTPPAAAPENWPSSLAACPGTSRSTLSPTRSASERREA